MALATRCPHCHTTFKVAQDQLKLRAGLVRCGACKQIFNGIEHLLRLEDARPDAASPSTAPPPSMPAATPAPLMDNGGAAPASPFENTVPLPAPSPETPVSGNTVQAAEPVDADEPNAQAVAPPPSSSASEEDLDPLQRMTLMDFTHIDADVRPDDAAPTPDYDPDAPDPLEQAIEDLQRKPLRGSRQSAFARDESEGEDDTDTDDEEPSFVKQGRRRQRMGRAMRIFMATGSFILLTVLLAQSVLAFRNGIAARFPETKPALAQACALLGCQVGLLAQSEAVAIESSELQAVAPEQGVFAFTVLLRNHGTTLQAWPHLELVLNDANEMPIARRVFAPREYLPRAQDPTQGFAPKAEQAVKLLFEMSQLKASGYRVYLFHP